MGLDVSFHPVAEADLQKYLFDVFDDPALGPVRAKEVTRNAELQGLILAQYRKFTDFQVYEEPIEGSYAPLGAMIAGALHPYWYSRGDSLSGLSEDHPAVGALFVPLRRLAVGAFRDIPNPSAGRITQNYTASDLIPYHAVPQLAESLRQLDAVLRDAWDPENLQSLQAAVQYAAGNRLGLMEAADLVVPISGDFSTDPENFRAPFIKKMAP